MRLKTSWMILVTHSCQFMGEMCLWLLNCLLFALNHPLLLHCAPLRPQLLSSSRQLQCLPQHLLPHLQSLLQSPYLLLLVLNAPDVLEMNGCQNSGLYPSAISRSGSQPQLFLHLMRKMVTRMIPWTFSMRIQPLPLNPHHIHSPNDALMQTCGIKRVRKRWRLTESMAPGKSSNYPQGSVQLAPGGS